MAATHQQQASSSVSSFEVFMSFHGQDVRRGFADHLYHRLVGARIRTFKDDKELEKGKLIGPGLSAAIQQSIISIPIFSMNYGSSKWCLDELKMIRECQRIGKQTVLPIFYKVEPKDVRNQTSDSYKKAFDDEHPKHFSKKTVQEWRDDLREIGKLNGWHCNEETQEGKLVTTIVKEVSSRLNKGLKPVLNYLVGMESHLEKMLELLDIECQVTKIIGIHGFCGIGKTMIARAVCNEVLSRFDEYVFVENVRERTKNFGIRYLLDQLSKAILGDGILDIVDVDDGMKAIQQRLCTKRVLFVLDDVDQDIQVESLIGDGEWFGIGSRIIITSRNEDILIARKAHKIYKPDLMGLDDSLELFRHYAFQTNQPQEDFLDISKEIVATTGGHPLALRFIGSSLFTKARPIWEDMLKKLQKYPNHDVMKSLKISYDDLGDMERHFFLDIACFFNGMKEDIVCHIWAGCNFHPKAGLQVLRAKSLIMINEDDELRMPNVVRDLGRYIVRQESRKAKERSRICSEEEVLDVLFKPKGTCDCLGLSTIDFNKNNVDSKSKSRSKCLMSAGLDAMTELRFLQLDHTQISGDCINTFSNLIWLSWKGCPEQYALTKFYPEKLVVLDLSYSEITESWMGWKHIKVAVKLKVLKLESCQWLCNTPVLSENQLLEILSFKNCEKLDRIDSSIGSLMKLVTLDLSGCSSLKGIPTEIGFLMSLATLNLSNCRRLEGLPTEIGYLKKLVALDLRGCKRLFGLPTEVGFLTSLITLLVDDCERLVKLPIEICQLTFVKTLILCQLHSLIHFNFGGMTSLKKLELANCHSLKDISSLPPCLTSIRFSFCTLLQSIPSLPSGLTSIEFSNCDSLPCIPSLPSGLTSVDVYNCNLVQSILLPSSLTTLSVHSCNSLVALASGLGSGLKNLKTLKVCLCRILEEIKGVDEKLESLQDCQILWCYSIKLLPKLRCSKNLRSLTLVGLDAMSHFEGEGMDSLEELYINRCSSLKKIPYLRDSKGLREVYIRDCLELTEIECREGYESLQILNIRCTSLTTLSDDISTLKNLRELEIVACGNLSEIPSLSRLESLQSLKIESCHNLAKIHSFDGLEVLCSLKIIECCSLEGLPDLSNLKNLRKLWIVGCSYSMEQLLAAVLNLKGLSDLRIN